MLTQYYFPTSKTQGIEGDTRMNAILQPRENCQIHCCDILNYFESILFTLPEYETVKLSIIDHNTSYNEKMPV